MLLSRMVGGWDDYYKILADKATSGSLGAPVNYLDLSNYYIARKETALGEETLREGLRAFPDSENLQITLLYFLSNGERYHEAMSLFTQYPGLKQVGSLRSLYVYLAINLNRYDEAFKMVNAISENEWMDNPAMVEMVALLYRETGDNQRAEALYRIIYEKIPGRCAECFALGSRLSLTR